MAMTLRRYRVNQSYAAGDKPHEIHFVWGFPHRPMKGKTMSTRNVNGTNAVRKAARATAQSVLDRDAELELIELGLAAKKEAELRDIAIAGRVLEQEANDQMAVVQEERGQTGYMAHGNPTPPATAPAEPPATAVLPVTPAPATTPAPVAPAASAVDTTPPVDGIAELGLDAPAAPAAVAVANGNVVNVNNGVGGFVTYTRTHFGAWVWVIAIVFLLIAFSIMHNAYPGFYPDKTGGLSLGVREFLAFLLIPLFWGFIGGVIGSLISWRRAIRIAAAPQPVVVTAHVPPAA
jgi:hypothetical protein